MYTTGTIKRFPLSIKRVLYIPIEKPKNPNA